ncbi:MAG: glycosyltransferase family 2 protein [Propioniciclava sp.]|uniref:glycosyltransferase family 2 protein n=1 Tax=Propioniciclava sp. TaxID=2038686 RepID=UPI0039E5CB72
MAAVNEDLTPIRCVTWAVEDAVDAALQPNADGRLFVLATAGGWPAAVCDVRAATAAEAAGIVRRAVAEEGVRPPSGFVAGRPTTVGVSVVVCTLGREPRLTDTVAALLAQTHTNIEILVVDNDPGSGRVPALLAGVGDPRLRIIDQPRRGLSAARNAGLAEAGHPVVAFTDDDALPDPGWVAALASVFESGDQVDCVTGLVLPTEVATRTQLFFEEAGGFAKGLRAVHWRRGGTTTALGTQPGPEGLAFPFDACYGSGNNMAFRAEALRARGGFDEALGAGSPTRGGEDLDAFQTVYLDGGTVVYWPAALVRHHHRADHDALVEQMYGYGLGMAAVVAKRLLSSPATAAGVLRKLPGGLRLLLDSGSNKNKGKTAAFPAQATWAERRGYLAGPAVYLGARIRQRRSARRPRQEDA